MEETLVNEKDEIVIKLLHYFIVEEGYNPIVLHGAQNEIWLENLNSDYKIVRIVSNYIHNNDQMDFDLFKTKQIMKKIKKKTLSMSLNSLNLYVNLGENVNLDKFSEIDNIVSANINSVDDIYKYNFIIDEFPEIDKKLKFTEKGLELFSKLSTEINKKGEEDARSAEEVFTPKKPIITRILILINVIYFIITVFLTDFNVNNAQNLFVLGANYRDAVLNGEVWRLLTSMFMHASLIHLLLNMYALNVIGPQLEGFYGKIKYLVIYLASGITGGLLSILFSEGVSVGASGAIFGLLGSLLYFGYHYRVYLENAMKSQIIPLIIINLVCGFLTPGIDNGAHIGGLIGGILISMAVGVKNKSTNSDKINGYIMFGIYIAFLIYLNFFR